MASDDDFRAGAASLPLTPPLGLPMVGFIRQSENGLGHGRFPLEVGAIALERGDVRVVLVGVDVLGIASPEVDALIDRVAAATGADPAGVILNWNHTHLSPPGGEYAGALVTEIDDATRASVRAFSHVLHDAIVSVARLAVDRLEPAGVVWGQRGVDIAVNRRERTPDGSNGGTLLGWNPELLLDDQVTVLQLRRPDETPIATAVGFGCHPVTTGYDMYVYAADFPGPMRDVVREHTGGECVFLQGAGGNVLPRFAFTDTEDEAERMGRRLGLAALEAVADRTATPTRIVPGGEASATPIRVYRQVPVDAPAPALAALRTTTALPLQPWPDVDDVAAQRAGFDAELERARRTGRGAAKVAAYHAGWAARTEDALRAGTAPREIVAPVHAVRIGDGLIVTGPAETFTETGMAVKERVAGTPTFYAGYTNGMIGYVPTEAEYPFGGYEAGYGYKSTGLPSHFDPSSARRLVEAGVRLAERLFPDAEPWDGARGWEATGALPELPPVRFVHPDA